MAYTLSEIRPDDKRGQTKLRTLLEGEGITLDGNLDYTCGLFDEDYQLVATGSTFGVHTADTVFTGPESSRDVADATMKV